MYKDNPLQRLKAEVSKNIEEEGASGILTTIDNTIDGIEEEIIHQINIRRGQNIYERDWDVLILLDCARVDMIKEISHKYEFLERVGTHTTLGTSSQQWMKSTFTDKYESEMSDTVMVTANPNTHKCLNADDFSQLEEVWKDEWNDQLKTIPAPDVTDRAITLHRFFSPKRMIIHYMQPHIPFVPRPNMNAAGLGKPGVEKNKMNIEELHKKEGYSRQELWEAHMENLEYVLDSVELLLSNMNADKVVISSDHGQALGEDGVWGHPSSTLVDTVREVPWCITSGTDTGEYHPESKDDLSSPHPSIEEKLEHLGYK